MTTRGKDLNESSRARIAYEQNEIARLQEKIASGKGNKRSQGALDKKLALVATIEAKLTARLAKKSESKSNETQETAVESDDSAVEAVETSNDVSADVDAAIAAATGVQVDSLENVAV